MRTRKRRVACPNFNAWIRIVSVIWESVRGGDGGEGRFFWWGLVGEGG